jgi:hypothetical protein
MTELDPADRPPPETVHRRVSRIHRAVVRLLQVIMAISLGLSIYERLGDPSGLTDSFVDLWIRRFIESNPRLFSD